MKFYAEPNMLVKVNRKGKLRNVKSFRFDEKGEFITDNPYLINVLKRRFKSDSEVVEEVETIEEEKEMTYQEVKSYAKTLGINTYGMKREQIEEAIKGVK